MHTEYAIVFRTFILAVAASAILSLAGHIAKADKSATFVKDPKVLLLQANLYAAKGQTDRAIKTYSKIVSEHPDRRQLVLLARRKLLAILLNRTPPDYDAIETHLTAFLEDPEGWDNELWNYSFRVLIGRVQMADDTERAEVWESGFNYLRGKKRTINKKNLKEFDELCKSLDDSKFLSMKTLLKNVLSLDLDAYSYNTIRSRLQMSGLKQSMNLSQKNNIAGISASVKGRQLLLRAAKLEMRGHVSQAIAAYMQIVSENPNQPGLIREARLRVLALMIDQAPVNHDAVAAHLKALSKTPNGIENVLSNLSFQWLIRRVRLAKKTERKTAWQKGLSEITSSRFLLSKKSLKRLDKLIVLLAETGTSEDTFLRDMALLQLAPESKSAIQSRISTVKFRDNFRSAGFAAKSADTTSGKYRSLLMRAASLNSKGDTKSAIALYSKIIAENPINDVLITARHRLLPLLLDQSSVNKELAESTLQVLVRDQGGLDNTLWNYSLRLLLQRVRSVEPSHRVDIWAKGIGEYTNGKYVLRAKSYDELNGLLQSLGREDTLTAETVLTDMLRICSHSGLSDWLRIRKIGKELHPQWLTDKSRIISADKNTRKLMLKASSLSSQEDYRGAIETYSEIITQNRNNKQIVHVARQKMLPLFFEQTPFAMAATEAHLKILIAEDGELDQKLWTYSLRLLIRRVRLAPGNKQLDTWKVGLSTLKGSNYFLERKLFNELESLAGEFDMSDVLPINVFWGNVLDLNINNVSRVAINSRINTYRFSKAFKSSKSVEPREPKITPELRQLMLSAQLMKEKGEFLQSCSLFTEIIQKRPDNKELVRLARKNLVEILLDMESVNVNLVEQHLSSLVSEATDPDIQLWNYKCRLLFRQVLMSSPEQQKNTWRSGVRSLSDAHIVLNKKALEDLDSFVGGLGDGSHLSPMRVLTDVMLLGPEISSMRQLNWRRISTFSRKANWPEAISAAKLDVMLSLASPEGPSEAINRCLKIMEAAEVPSGEQEEFVNSLFRVPWEGTCRTDDWIIEPRNLAVCADHLLRYGAERALAEEVGNRSLRQRLFLHLFAGQQERALKCAHKALVETAADLTCVLESFGDLSIALSVGDSRIRTTQEFLKWLSGGEQPSQEKEEGFAMNILDDDQLCILAEHEIAFRQKREFVANTPHDNTVTTYGNMNEDRRNDLINFIRSRFDKKMIDWGHEAFDHTEINLAAKFWSHAINSKNDSGQAKLIIDTIYQIAKGAGSIEVALEGMKQVLTRVNLLFSQNYVMKKIATLHYEQGNYAQCLATLDEADALRSESESEQDMATAFIRVLSMIRIRQFDKTLAMLQDMRNWPGTGKQHARVSFLEGWIFLQKNQKAKALLSFRRVMDKHGKTAFAKKAGELVQRLEGI